MPNFVIPSIFTAVDRFSGPVTGPMSRALATLGDKATVMGARAERAFNRIQNAAEKAYNTINIFPRLNSAAGMVGLTVGVAGATHAIGKFITEAQKMEDARASFTALLGGAQQAADMVRKLYELGAKTPFEFQDLADASRVMIGFGAATEKDIIQKLQMIGDIAQGNAEKLGGITLAFSQIEAAGKASMQDVNQLINNGVPILGQLAKQWHMTTGAAREAVSKGKATSAEINKAFQSMTKEGGMFYKGMEIASQTLSGRLSTLKDNVNMAFAGIGEAALPVIKEFVDKVISAAGKVQEWVTANKELIQAKVAEWADRIKNVIMFLYENMDNIILATKIYIGTLLFLKTMYYANIAAAVIYNSYLFLTNAALRKATIAQWAMNAAMLANPVTLITAAIMALIGVIVFAALKTEGWGKQWDATVKWMKTIFKAFALGLSLQFQVIQLAFWAMVNAIVIAWKWAQNKLGLLSDEQFAKDKARIKEETRLRVEGIRKTATELAATAAEINAGPGWHVKWKGEEEKEGGAAVKSINPKQQQQQMMMQTLVTNYGQKQSTEITIKDQTGKAEVTKNPQGIPIKIDNNILGQFGK